MPWDPGKRFHLTTLNCSSNSGILAGADIKLLHFRGIAQEYNGSGAYEITVKWLEGTRISNIKKYWIERGLVIDLRFPFAQNLL